MGVSVIATVFTTPRSLPHSPSSVPQYELIQFNEEIMEMNRTILKLFFGVMEMEFGILDGNVCATTTIDGTDERCMVVVYYLDELLRE